MSVYCTHLPKKYIYSVSHLSKKEPCSMYYMKSKKPLEVSTLKEAYYEVREASKENMTNTMQDKFFFLYQIEKQKDYEHLLQGGPSEVYVFDASTPFPAVDSDHKITISSDMKHSYFMHLAKQKIPDLNQCVVMVPIVSEIVPTAPNSKTMGMPIVVLRNE